MIFKFKLRDHCAMQRFTFIIIFKYKGSGAVFCKPEKKALIQISV